MPENLKAMEKELKSLQEEKASAVKNQNFEQAATIRDKEKSLKTLLDEEKEKWKNISFHKVREITSEDIASVVSAWTGIPANQITKEEVKKILGVEEGKYHIQIKSFHNFRKTSYNC